MAFLFFFDYNKQEMALTLKNSSKKRTWKFKFNRQGVQKEFKYRHCSMRKWARMGMPNGEIEHYPYIKFNVMKYLQANVGRPIDKIYSEFCEAFKRDYKGRYSSPHDLLYIHIADSREECSRVEPYYIANGILCKEKAKRLKTKKTYYQSMYLKFEEARKHNESVLKSITVSDWKTLIDKVEHGFNPVPIGDFWVVSHYNHYHLRFTKVYLTKKEYVGPVVPLDLPSKVFRMLSKSERVLLPKHPSQNSYTNPQYFTGVTGVTGDEYIGGRYRPLYLEYNTPYVFISKAL